MAEEIAALEHTDTWDLVPCHCATILIMCKLVYKIKTRSNGSIEHVLLHVVFNSSMVMTMRRPFLLLLTRPPFILLLWWPLFVGGRSLSLKNALLHGELHEEVDMHPPPGYSIPDGHVCHLHRTLYGLKQAPHAWFERFTLVLTDVGFVATQHDPALFIHTFPCGCTIILLYVDDMLIMEDDSKYNSFVKASLSKQFHMSNLGPLCSFLGLRSHPHLTTTTSPRESTF
jgi:hypothetical protein